MDNVQAIDGQDAYNSLVNASLFKWDSARFVVLGLRETHVFDEWSVVTGTCIETEEGRVLELFTDFDDALNDAQDGKDYVPDLNWQVVEVKDAHYWNHLTQLASGE